MKGAPKKSVNSNKKAIAKTRSKTPLPIVAIGASAGGLGAIVKFFEHIPAVCHMTFIVITHLNRDHKSLMPGLIQTHCKMPVIVITQGCKVEPNTVYVIPPGKNILIKNDELVLVEQDEPHYSNSPIDCFFHSLALAYKKNAVAVILSGCASDGSLGLKDIKQYGGIVIAQSPQSAEYDSMPLNAINTGMVDEILAPENIYPNLNRLLNSARQSRGHFTVDLQLIFEILQARTGNDFSGYKTSVLKRRIDRQLRRLNMTNTTDYIRYLQLNLDEVDILFQDLLIGVTSFFRDPDAFTELKHTIIPATLKNKPRDYTFRVWVPGCSTGQEVYSIAIILREYMKETNHYFPVQLFCTDIDQTALDVARVGLYSASITRDVSPQRLSTYFIKEKNGYKVTKEIREMIVFGVQNIIQDPPFTKIDLISCRNLLIYLSSASQRTLFPLMHFSLKPDGILFLGKSESATQYKHLFKPCGGKYNFFTKIESTHSRFKYVNHAIKKHLLNLSSFLPSETTFGSNHLDFEHLVNVFLVEAFVLPCVITNKQGNIIFTHGELSDYLPVNTQLIHVNLLDVVHSHIRKMLMPYFNAASAIKLNKSISKTLRDPNSTAFFINLTIMPINHINGLSNLTLVRFDKVATTTGTLLKTNAKNQLSDIEQELHLTKESLQSTIEELEASNEEMQSTNEEIQSINEELETSKEELQAVNEELLIVNTELQSRVEEASVMNDDMNSLFNNADIAAIFLNGALVIKQFTPKTQQLIHLIPADIGRPLKHFSTTIQKINLNEVAEAVLKSHKPEIFEAQATNGRWYHINVSPYRTLGNEIDGIVITFMEVTENKINEATLVKLRTELCDTANILDNILDVLQEPVIILDCDSKVVILNKLFSDQFLVQKDESIGKSFYEIGNCQWNISNLRKLLNKIIANNLLVNGYEIEREFPLIGHKKIIINIRKITHNHSRDLILLTVKEDRRRPKDKIVL